MRPVLALELSTDGILLHELSYDGVWRRIAAAALDDPFLPKRMKDMKATAKASQGRFFKNQIWLPTTQIEGIEVKLTSEEPEDRQREAEDILRHAPEYAGRDLVVQVGQQDVNGNTTIAAIDRQIMQEAQRFATGYGFSADGFTSVTRVSGFYQQPYFDLAGPVKVSVDFRKIGFIAALVLAAAGAIAGGLWAYKNLDFSPDPSTAIEATEARIFDATEDPRAPIRPTNAIKVNTSGNPEVLTSNQIPAQNPMIQGPNGAFGAQVTQMPLTSNTEMAQAPLPVTALSPVATTRQPSRAIAASTDSLPAPETSGFAVLEAELPTVIAPDGSSEFTGGTHMSTFNATLPENTFNITPRLTDVLPTDDSTVVLAAQLRKLNDSLGLTQVRENNAAVVRLARTAELQLLRANVTFGRPDLLPILRGGVEISDAVVVVTAPVEPTVTTLNAAEISRLQRLPATVTRGLPELTPILRNGINVADLPDDPPPPAVEDPDAEPTVMFTEILAGLTVEQLQRIPPRIITTRPPVLPILRGGVEIGAIPETVPEPVDPIDEATRIATLQAATANVQTGRPSVLPTLRDGIEVGLVPEVAPEPVDPATEASRIASLQSAPANVQTGRPALLPTLRGGGEILGGSGVIVEAPPEPALTDAARLRPLFRPQGIEVIALINDPALSEQAVTNTFTPLHRSAGFAARVEAMADAIAEQARTTPTYTAAPRDVSVPTSANVAREATIENGINLRATSLIGVYGKPGAYRALIRERGGKYTMVKVGDSVGGWQIVAIEESQVRIKRGSKTEILRLPAEG